LRRGKPFTEFFEGGLAHGSGSAMLALLIA
jgi:hypothetical protein